MRLALVAIVKDEEDCIERMLRSVASVTDEQIVVDTGSSDATPDIAVAAGAQLFRYNWDHSFSNARNFALSLTECPWRIVLDADEWLECGAEVLAETAKCPPNFVGRLEITSFFNNPTSPTDLLVSLDRVSRLLPMGVTYRGDIHEQPHHSLPIHELPITIKHDGYQTGKLNKKGTRNLLMLERALAHQDDDDYLRFQYARELKRHGRLAEAVENIDKVVRSLRIANHSVRWREDAICLALEIFADTAAFSSGLELIEAEANALEHSVDFWFSVGVFSFRLAERMPIVAAEAIARMETSFSYCLTLGGLGFRSRIVVGRESGLARAAIAALRATSS